MATPQELQHFFGALREELNTTFNERIVKLEAELRGLSSADSGNRPRPRPRLPDPVRFTGHAGDFDSWLLEIYGKMAIDADAIGDDQNQFRYWVFRLDFEMIK